MYYFIINPNSRSGHGLQLWQNAKKILDEKHIEYKSYFTQYPGHAIKLTRDIAKNNTSCTLSVLGGDGTLNEVINGLMGYDLSKITLGYIPTGSGNDFARGLGLTTDIKSCIESIINPSKFKEIDIGYGISEDFSRYFIVSSGIGYDAGICAEVSVTPLKKILNKLKIGKLTYVLVAIKQLILFHPCKLSVCIDQNEVTGFQKFFFLTAMNTKYEGGGAKFCPDAKYDDGLLDFCLINAISKLKILALFPTAFLGKHNLFKGVHIHRCHSIDVTSQDPMPVHFDGEVPGKTTHVKFSITDKKIHTIVG